MQARLASPDEAEQLWWVRNQAIRHGCRDVYDGKTLAAWTPDLMPEGYRQAVANNPFFVVDDPNSQVPVATGFLDLSSGSVEAIFTLPEFEGRGMATLILDAIKHEARVRGFTTLLLASTPNASAFYEKNGFTLISESFYPSQLAQTNLRCMDMTCRL
ncbi:GNAT family N-acetyltransferase [Yersinia alsatica]|uniref:GNAT family N-acetyltransferase n=1 Tax=Yersinia alsatica TaxID=2890317 RepID=A0ABY5UPF1_9GAMM|nr:GNAT family N-acetyltransferase [Yersinia alsatica]OWF69419.1 GNAT family N-acetyltransferase [Yersinia frederiksenii]OWF73231.1 GNAT family N-acetyltransferase [Yersinia frederiksenii]UWM45356.1 GNAT family N-acetyltransferase [Yersinia alsatica]CNL27487.1 FR47-like protein [Yersinia frederiksenii]CNL57059.1 FR47-like protein [Yersinia frederiksenii]